jgi:hypothetical protein
MLYELIKPYWEAISELCGVYPSEPNRIQVKIILKNRKKYLASLEEGISFNDFMDKLNEARIRNQLFLDGINILEIESIVPLK